MSSFTFWLATTSFTCIAKFNSIVSFFFPSHCTRVMMRVQWLGMDQKTVLRTIELLGEKVMPALNAN